MARSALTVPSLCMFTEPSGEWVGGFATPSFAHYGSVNNLFVNYI